MIRVSGEHKVVVPLVLYGKIDTTEGPSALYLYDTTDTVPRPGIVCPDFDDRALYIGFIRIVRNSTGNSFLQVVRMHQR